MRTGGRCLLLLPLLACRPPRAPDRDGADALRGPLDDTFQVPDWRDRDYILHLPPSYDGGEMPLVLAFHGGGGRKEGVNRTTCRDGDESADDCLFAVADREGFIVVAPDGVDAPGIKKRSWNAGGGEDGWGCVGGEACDEGSDDVGYVDALLDELNRALYVDSARIYATGISNGGAMSHRLACDRADVFAAIAPVAGENQAQGWPGCEPSRAVPVLDIHGTEDPCWGWDGTSTNGICGKFGAGTYMDVDTSMGGWWERNGCVDSEEQATVNAVTDGTSVTEVDGVGCAADTVLLRIGGGGHTWPDGWQYLGQSAIGRVSKEFTGSDRIWSFFQDHPLSN